MSIEERDRFKSWTNWDNFQNQNNKNQGDKTLIIAVDDDKHHLEGSVSHINRGLELLFKDPKSNLTKDSVRIVPIEYDPFEPKLKESIEKALQAGDQPWSWKDINRVLACFDNQLGASLDGKHNTNTLLANLVPWLQEKGKSLFYFIRSNNSASLIAKDFSKIRKNLVKGMDLLQLKGLWSKLVSAGESFDIKKILSLKSVSNDDFGEDQALPASSQDENAQAAILYIPKDAWQYSEGFTNKDMAALLDWLNKVIPSDANNLVFKGKEKPKNLDQLERWFRKISALDLAALANGYSEEGGNRYPRLLYTDEDLKGMTKDDIRKRVLTEENVFAIKLKEILGETKLYSKSCVLKLEAIYQAQDELDISILRAPDRFTLRRFLKGVHKYAEKMGYLQN